jgi:hypothetical protein
MSSDLTKKRKFKVGMGAKPEAIATAPAKKSKKLKRARTP